MAKRRCISIDFYECEEFLGISDKAKVLYTGLILRSDDEGVVINHGIALRLLGINPKYFDELLHKGLILNVEGIYVIRHWYLHNKIQPSRIVPSLYQNELTKLYVSDRKTYEFVEE